MTDIPRAGLPDTDDLLYKGGAGVTFGFQYTVAVTADTSIMASIENVSDTAFWVAHFRARESARGDALFHDPFAFRLVGDRGRKISESMAKTSRYTEWSVVSRTVIIDRFISQLVGEGVDTVVNLGAGLDTRPYRMDLPSGLEWVEADFPNIITHKQRLLESERPRCRLTRIQVDLSDSTQRRELLASSAANAKRVLILTEGVIPYLSPEQVTELSTDLRAHQRIIFWVTEYFHPRVYPYLQKAVRVRAMKNAPFRFYPEDWFGFFRKLGWSERETRYSGEIACEFNRAPPMPWLVKMLMPMLPGKVRDEAMRMTGFSVLTRTA